MRATRWRNSSYQSHHVSSTGELRASRNRPMGLWHGALFVVGGGERAEARYRSDVAMKCLIVSESQTWEMQR